MRPLITAAMLIAACVSPQPVEALGCAVRPWINFEHTGGDIDPATRERDVEARNALDDLYPIVFRGRFAWGRDLFNRRGSSDPVYLFVFEDVEVLHGEMPWSAYDRRAFLVYGGWCDGRCSSASQWASDKWPPGEIVTVGARRPIRNGPVTGATYKKDGTFREKVVYTGRVDATLGACDPTGVSRLLEELLTGPPEEIARLMREYHRPRKQPAPGSQ